MYFVSQQLWDKLQEQAGPCGRPTFNGEPVKIGAHLPTRKLVGAKSHDRFVEYDVADLSWAEPLGLAEPIYEEVHGYHMDESLMFRFNFDFGPRYFPSLLHSFV